MNLHTGLQSVHSSADVNSFIRTALRYAAEVRRRPEPHAGLPGEIRAQFDALPAALRPFTLDQLRAHAATASDAQERIDALRGLEWVVAR
jgi:hypothetical protein